MLGSGFGLGGIAVGNLDADPAAEVVWSSGLFTHAGDTMLVADSVTHLHQWMSTDISGGLDGVGGGDVDDDGRPEIFFTAPRAYAIHDGATKDLEVEGATTLAATRIVSGDATGSPEHELFFAGTFEIHRAGLACTDLAGDELWNAQLDFNTKFRALAVADVDADGELEVVATVFANLNDVPGPYLYIYDAASGLLEGQSPDIPLSWQLDFSLLRIANVDGDPALEAVVAATHNGLRVLDLQTHAEQFVTADLDIVAVDTPNLDGLGPAEILVGTATGLVRTIDGTGSPTTLLGPLGVEVHSLVAHDFTGDDVPDYLYASNNAVVIRDGVDGSQRWSSGPLGQSVGVGDTIRVGDFDGDGETEILVGLQQAVAMFGDDVRDNALLRDGFESGGFFKWAVE